MTIPGENEGEDALRALVREAIARRLHAAEPGPSPLIALSHVSHYRYGLPESDGPCLIEPAVQCNHCGYCQSHGH
jgi:hypothetical protein